MKEKKIIKFQTKWTEDGGNGERYGHGYYYSLIGSSILAFK